MADTKISALTAATTPLDGTEEVAIVQSSTTKRVAVSEISAFSAMQLTNTDTTTGINTATLTVIPLATATSFGSDFTQVGNTIRADFDGVVRLSANVYMTATAVRGAVGIEYFKNSTSLGLRFNTSYIRVTSGHDEASTVCSAFLVSCSNGDTFDIRGIREAAGGSVTMASSGSTFLQVERVE